MSKTGSLSINSENIFPVIKKWLYSDHDIFVRELVSNSTDALTKLNKLSVFGEWDKPDDFKERIEVRISPKNKTIKIVDNGLGMTEDELVEYLTQIAFSGATKFLENYEDKENKDQIIGHFGLGFYSAFMVADKVTVDSLSYKNDSEAVLWSCDGGTEYELESSSKDSIGTTITLYLNDNCYEFSNEYRVREVLDKYCSFMPYEIYLINEDTLDETETINASDVQDTDTVVEEFDEEKESPVFDDDGKIVEGEKKKEIVKKAKIKKRNYPINDIHPLWTKNPSECTEEEYNDFYHKVFKDYRDPLFKIHLNMDYPFNLKGILYFPRISTEYESIEGTIKLYSNQVFVADNVKEVIPEFLLLLKGVIDCKDIPLNVSRSALQNDGFAQKIADYIVKKVADKLVGLYKTERESYEKYWDDINPFIKYGCIRDEKFFEKLEPYILFKTLDDKYYILEDIKKQSMEAQGITSEDNKEEAKEDDINEKKTPVTIYYSNDVIQESSYIELFKAEGIPAIVLDKTIDAPFLSEIERRSDNSIRFARVDSEINSSSSSDDELSEEELNKYNDELAQLFKKALEKESLNIKVKYLKDNNVSALMLVSEQGRRMADMMKAYGMGDLPNDNSMELVVNINNDLVKSIIDCKEEKLVNELCCQVYDLAELGNRPLSSERMAKFISRSNSIMLELAKGNQ